MTGLPVAILAGGLATRMRPLTETVPKSLLEVNGEPFIAHQLRLLASKGIREVVLCIGHLGEQVEAFVQSGSQFGIEVHYSFDGAQLLGTAGALKRALPLLGERFFIVYGDSYLPCDYAAVGNAFIKSHCLAMMTVFKNENRWDKSNIEFNHNRIIAYDKKVQTPAMHYIDYGLGIIHKQAFDLVEEGLPCDLASLYQQLLAQNQLAAFEVPERFYEMGSFAGLEELRHYLAKTKA